MFHPQYPHKLLDHLHLMEHPGSAKKQKQEGTTSVDELKPKVPRSRSRIENIMENLLSGRGDAAEEKERDELTQAFEAEQKDKARAAKKEQRASIQAGSGKRTSVVPSSKDNKKSDLPGPPPSCATICPGLQSAMDRRESARLDCQMALAVGKSSARRLQ